MMAHFTYREIAEKLGVDSSTISEDVKVIRERWRERATADYASDWAEEIARLDFLEHELLPKALHGGPEGGVNLRAVDRVLAIRDRRAGCWVWTRHRRSRPRSRIVLDSYTKPPSPPAAAPV
jgi:hypothetical protein